METKNKNQQPKYHLSLFATEEEARMFEQIKKFHCRRSDSDMIRFLINQESQKIFSSNIPLDIKSAVVK